MSINCVSVDGKDSFKKRQSFETFKLLGVERGHIHSLSITKSDYTKVMSIQQDFSSSLLAMLFSCLLFFVQTVCMSVWGAVLHKWNWDLI